MGFGGLIVVWIWLSVHVERKKLIRIIRRNISHLRALSSPSDSSNASTSSDKKDAKKVKAEKLRLETELRDARVMLNYILFYPYVAPHLPGLYQASEA